MIDNIAFVIVALAWLQTAAALTSTYSKTTIKLRFASVLANVCGVVVNAASANLAGLLRHLVILPIDITRFPEMRKLIAQVKTASEGGLNAEWLKPFMHPRWFKEGEILFRKGDTAEEAFMLIEGQLELVEVGEILAPGSLFGEMALFTPTRARTATVASRTDGHLLAITYQQLELLYFQNPSFGLYLIRLIMRRLQTRLAQSEALHPNAIIYAPHA